MVAAITIACDGAAGIPGVVGRHPVRPGAGGARRLFPPLLTWTVISPCPAPVAKLSAAVGSLSPLPYPDALCALASCARDGRSPGPRDGPPITDVVGSLRAYGAGARGWVRSCALPCGDVAVRGSVFRAG